MVSLGLGLLPAEVPGADDRDVIPETMSCKPTAFPRGQGKVAIHGVEGPCCPAVRVGENRSKVFDCTDRGIR
jgi:hypothetical protein